MEENFSMEWNMEWKIFGKEWKKIASMEYGKIVFHSIQYHALLAVQNAKTFSSGLRQLRNWKKNSQFGRGNFMNVNIFVFPPEIFLFQIINSGHKSVKCSSVNNEVNVYFINSLIR